MTQIFTGEGLGVQGSFSNETTGISRLGQSGGSIHVNAANGNMVLRQEDGFLADQGFGLNLVQTYNSRGEHSANWIFNIHTRLFFKGSPNTAGSIIERIDEDGHKSIFVYDAVRQLYRPKDDSTASLRYVNGFWEYSSGNSGIFSKYDTAGQLQSIHDRDGHSFSFHYEQGRLFQIVNMNGKQEVTWTFDALGRLKTVCMQSEGKTIHQVAYVWDELGRLSSLSRGNGEKYFHINYAYDGDSQRIRYLEQSDGVYCYFEYDQEGRLVKLRDGTGAVTHYKYETGKTFVTLPSGQTWVYHYDEKSRIKEIEIPGQYPIQYSYENNHLSSITQGSKIWRFYYNETGDCERTIEPSGRIITRIFDDQHRLLKEESILPFDGHYWPSRTDTHRYIYDAAGHLRFTIRPDGSVCENRYNKQGLLFEKRIWSMPFQENNANVLILEDMENWVSRQNPQQITLESYAYDWRGQCTKRTIYNAVNMNGEGLNDNVLMTFFEYDAAGRLVSESTPLTEGFATTWYFYDYLGRLEKVINPSGKIKRWEYDDNHQRIIETDAGGLQTITQMDARGCIISVHTLSAAEDFGTTSFTLDVMGNRICETDATGLKTWHFYNETGKLQGTVTADGQLTLFTYDAFGNVIQVRICSAPVDTHAWDTKPPALATFIQEKNASDRITHQIYDARGFLKAVIDAEGGVIVYSLDAAGQVMEKRALAKKFANPDPELFTSDAWLSFCSADDRCVHYYYDANNQLQATVDGEGYATHYKYNAAGQIIETIRYYASISQFSGMWNKDAPSASKKDIHTYTFYNAAGLKTAEIDPEGYLTEYRYNARGLLEEIKRWYNRVSLEGKPDHPERMRPMPDDRDQCTQYRYNDAGLCIEERDPNGLVTTFTHDDMGRVISITRQDIYTGDKRLAYKRYDTAGRLIAELDAKAAALLQNGQLDAAAIEKIWNKHGVHFYYDSSNRLTHKTTAQGESTWYFYDKSGLPVYTVAADGAVTETRYNVFHQVSTIVQYSIALGESPAQYTMESLQKRLQTLRSKSDKITQYTYSRTGLLESITTGEQINKILEHNAFGEIETSYNILNAKQTLQTKHLYDRRGLLTGIVKDPADLRIESSNIYDAFGRLQDQYDARANGLHYEYDNCGRVLFITRDDNTWRSMSWDAFGRILEESDWTGSQIVRWQYEKNRFSRYSDEQCLSITQTNAFGETIGITDAGGRTTEYIFDERGFNTEILGQDGTRKYRYDEAGHLVWEEDAGGHITVWTYDAIGRRLTETRDPDGLALTKSYTFDALGRQLTMQEGGQIQIFSWDAEGMLASVCVDPEGLNLLTTFTYDAMGHLVRKTIHNPEGDNRITAFVWDTSGRRIATIEDPDHLALTTRYAYDATDNLIKVTNPAGYETHYLYNAHNKCVFVIDACGQVTESRYDVNGNNTYIIKYANAIKDKIPDSESEMKTRLIANDKDEWQCRIFDSQNRIAQYFDAEGYGTAYYYDAAGNIRKTLHYAQALSQDALKSGRFSLPSEKDARQTLYFHDTSNRLRFTIDSQGYVKEQIWDKSGQCIKKIAYATRLDNLSMKDMDALQKNLRKDNLHDQTIHYSYDQAGRLSFQCSAEGTVTSWKYDAADHVIETTIHTVRMTYNTGDFVSVTKHAEDHSTRFLYDTAGRLLYKISAEGTVCEYGYDSANNLIQETIHASRYRASEANVETLKHFFANPFNLSDNRSTHYYHDAAGRIVSTKNAENNTTDFEYDQAGNVKRKTDADGAIWTYIYDPSNRLLETRSPVVSIHRKNAHNQYVQTQCQIVTRQTYDSFGNIITRTEDAEGDAVTTRFQYDRKNNLCEIQYHPVGVCVFSDQASPQRYESIQTLTEKKIWNAFGELLAVKDKADNWRYFARDNTGHLRFTLEPNGALTQYRYDGFGNCIMTIAHALPQQIPAEKHLDDFERFATYSSKDRQSWMEFDRENRLVTTRHDIERSYNATTQMYENIHPETRITYDAFGQISTKSVRLHANDWAENNFYYDRDGQIHAEVDALGHLNIKKWNAFGECEEEIQYAHALTTVYDGNAPEISTEDRRYVYQYDSMGRLIKKTAKQVQYQIWQGHSYISTFSDLNTSYAWDSMGNMIEMQDAAGFKIHMYYDALGQLIAKIGPANERKVHSATTFAYDARGKLVETHEWEKGAVEAHAFTWQLNGQSAKDIITKREYDAAGQCISTTDGMNHQNFFSYDANGHMVREWDVFHQWNETMLRDKYHTYDAVGKLVETRIFKNDREYFTEDYSWNMFGELNAKGVNKTFNTRMDYDKLGRVWRTNIQGYYEIFLYNASDHITQVITASNATDIHESMDLSSAIFDHALRFDQDGWAKNLQRQDRIVDALGHKIQQRSWIEDGAFNLHEVNQTWKYDRFGNMISHRNTEGYETCYTWNALDVLIRQTMPEVTIETEQGQILHIKPEQNFACDVLGRIIAIIDAQGNTVHRRYDAIGQLVEETDAKGLTISKTYDLLGQLVSIQAPETAVVYYTYDQAKRLVEVVSGKQRQSYVLDEAGHILRSANGKDAIQYWYDNRGNLVKKRDANDGETVYRYDDENHKIEERDALGNTQKWAYEQGQLKSHTDLGNHTTFYTRNINGLVTDETSTRGRKIEYRYMRDGKLRQFEDQGHRETINFTYDTEGRIKTRESGRVAAGRDGWLPEQEAYIYDALGRLISVQRTQPGEENADNLTAQFSYDAVGNIRHTKVINQRKNAQTTISDDYYLYDANNRMVINKGSLINGRIAINASQGTETIYDVAGNIKQARKYEGNKEQIWKYWYTANNQLELIEKNGKRVQTKDYDEAGRIKRETFFNAKNAVDKTQILHWDKGAIAQVSIQDPYGLETSKEKLEYDAVGNRIKSVLRVHGTEKQAGATITHNYAWDEKLANYQQTRDEVHFSVDKGTTTTGLSTRNYDVNGQLEDAIDHTSNDRQGGNTTHYWFSSLDGMRAKVDKTGQTTYLNLGGKTIGDIHNANDGTSRINVYGGFSPSNNQTTSKSENILPEMPQTVQGEYILQANDNLELIALQMYGDSSLWYIIADANGLTSKDATAGSMDTLRIGQRLIIPAVSMGQHHTSKTHSVNLHPMNDSSPTVATPKLFPPPRPRKHSLLAKIMVTVISMVATVITAGILGVLTGAASAFNSLGGLIRTGFDVLSGSLGGGGLLGMSLGFSAGFSGSIAGQGMANLLGMQKGLDINNALINGLATALGTIKLPGSELVKDTVKDLSCDLFNTPAAAQMMQSNALNQGLNLTFHRQSRFNWGELIATGVAAGVLGGEKLQNINNKLRNQYGQTGKIINKQLQSLAQESTQSLLTGNSINPLQTLENTIGSTIADTLLDYTANQPPTEFQKQEDLFLSDTLLDILHPERTAEEIYQLSLKQKADVGRKLGNYENSEKRINTQSNEITNDESPNFYSMYTQLIGNTSMANGVLKTVYEGVQKHKVAMILNRAKPLHNAKIKDLSKARDLQKAQKVFKSGLSKSAEILKEAQTSKVYSVMSKFGTTLNVLYVGGEAISALIESDSSNRVKEVVARTVGATVAIGGGVITTHGLGFVGGFIGGPIGYASVAFIGNIAYSLKGGAYVSNITAEFIRASWEMGPGYYKNYKVPKYEVDWMRVAWSNKA